jgi:hypothetical protein
MRIERPIKVRWGDVNMKHKGLFVGLGLIGGVKVRCRRGY